MDASDKTQLDNNTGEWVREGLSIADADAFAAKLVPSWEIPESVQASSVVLNFSDTPAISPAKPEAQQANEAQLEQIIQSSQISAVKEPALPSPVSSAAPVAELSGPPTPSYTEAAHEEPHGEPLTTGSAATDGNRSIVRASAQPTQRIKHVTGDDLLVFPAPKPSSRLLWILAGAATMCALGYWAYTSTPTDDVEAAKNTAATDLKQPQEPGQKPAPSQLEEPNAQAKTSDAKPVTPTQITLNVVLNPGTAKMLINGKPFKKRELKVTRGSVVELFVSAEGFKDERRVITPTEDMSLTIDLVPQHKTTQVAAKKLPLSTKAAKVKTPVKHATQHRAPVKQKAKDTPPKKPKGVGFVTDNPY